MGQNSQLTSLYCLFSCRWSFYYNFTGLIEGGLTLEVFGNFLEMSFVFNVMNVIISSFEKTSILKYWLFTVYYIWLKNMHISKLSKTFNYTDKRLNNPKKLNADKNLNLILAAAMFDSLSFLVDEVLPITLILKLGQILNDSEGWKIGFQWKEILFQIGLCPKVCQKKWNFVGHFLYILDLAHIFWTIVSSKRSI